MTKPKEIKKEARNQKTGGDAAPDSAASQDYIYLNPTEYRITIPSLEAWGYGERARVELRQDNDPVGSIVFYKEGHAIPEDSTTDTGFVKMHLPYNMYIGVMDILRLEKPVMLDFNAVEKKAFLVTDWEPIGEGE